MYTKNIESMSLNKDISCDHICGVIQKLVAKFQQSDQNISDAVLVIEIKTVSQTTDSLIPKLEYKI